MRLPCDQHGYIFLYPLQIVVRSFSKFTLFFHSRFKMTEPIGINSRCPIATAEIQALKLRFKNRYKSKFIVKNIPWASNPIKFYAVLPPRLILFLTYKPFWSIFGLTQDIKLTTHLISLQRLLTRIARIGQKKIRVIRVKNLNFETSCASPKIRVVPL